MCTCTVLGPNLHARWHPLTHMCLSALLRKHTYSLSSSPPSVAVLGIPTEIRGGPGHSALVAGSG